MKKFSTIEVKRAGLVTELRLNRPEVKNAIDSATMLDLCEFFENASSDVSRVVVITANGSDFCSGADLTWMKGMLNHAAQPNMQSNLLVRMYTAFHRAPMPLVARVFGRVYAGGIGIASVCDAVFADENSDFCLSEVRVGLAPLVMAPFVAEKMGTARFRELALSTRRFGADEAQRIGLVNFVTTTDTADSAVGSYLEKLLRSRPGATASTKAVCRELSFDTWEKMAPDLARSLDERRKSTEAQTAIAAFLTKVERPIS